MNREALVELLIMSRELLECSQSASLVTHYNPTKFNYGNYTKKLHEITLELSDEEIKKVYPEGFRRY